MRDYPIDFVVLYCDGADPDFAARKNRYMPVRERLNEGDQGTERYRDMGTLRYWFRAVEAHAPWVRTIHLVTDNQVPDWIVREHPKLHLVNHSDIIPQQYLPLFNSSAIEIFVHRIEGLAEHFVYFNDDLLLNAPVTPNDYFGDGLPRHLPLFTNRFPKGREAWYYQQYNNLRLAERHCSPRKNYWRIVRNAVGPAYGWRYSYRNWVLLTAAAMAQPGFMLPWMSHQSNPMRKTTWEQMWEWEEEDLELTASHRFRECTDVNQRLFVLYDVFSGGFRPSYRTWFYAELDRVDMDALEDSIRDAKVLEVCVNDKACADFEERMSRVLAALAYRYPQPSTFEKQDIEI